MGMGWMGMDVAQASCEVQQKAQLAQTIDMVESDTYMCVLFRRGEM